MEAAATGHRIARIGGQIHQHLLDLSAVGAHDAHRWLERKRERDGFAE